MFELEGFEDEDSKGQCPSRHSRAKDGRGQVLCGMYVENVYFYDCVYDGANGTWFKMPTKITRTRSHDQSRLSKCLSSQHIYLLSPTQATLSTEPSYSYQER